MSASTNEAPGPQPVMLMGLGPASRGHAPVDPLSPDRSLRSLSPSGDRSDSDDEQRILRLRIGRKFCEWKHRVVPLSPAHHPGHPSVVDVFSCDVCALGEQQHGIDQEETRGVLVWQGIVRNRPPDLLRDRLQVERAVGREALGVSRGRKRKSNHLKRPRGTGRVTPSKDSRGDEDGFTHEGLRVRRDGRTVTWETTPDFDPAAWRKRWVDDGRRAAIRSAEIITELRALTAAVNTLHLVGQVTSMLTTGAADIDDAADRFGSEAQAEFLTEVAVEAGSPAGAQAGPPQVFRALDLLEELFEAESARIMGEEAGSAGTVLDEARFLLRHEALRDRMQGYVPHLRTIAVNIFGRIRSECVDALGFCPADIPALVQAHHDRRQGAFQTQLELADQIPVSQLQGLSAPPAVVRFSWVVFSVNEPGGDIDPAELAGDAGVGEAETRAILAAMSTPWGQPISDLRPGETHRIRRRPVLEGTNGRYAWPLTWSSVHEVVPWFNDLVSANEALQRSFRAARADATEELVIGAMRQIFGDDRVQPNFEYPIGGGNWAECDVVVELPDHAIAIECKSGALADGYRAGEAEYTASTFATLVEDPFGQSARAAGFLTAGPGRWRTRGSQQKRDWPGVSAAIRIAVTLERIDPLALIAARADLSPKAGEATWVVCLADLLMIAEILDDPHSFAAYADLRAGLASNTSVAVISEVDLLGAFLHDRLKSLRKSAASGPNVLAGLNHYAGDLNAYFTMMTLGLSLPKKPGVTLGERARRAVVDAWESGDASWLDLVRRHISDRR